jgi:hypothetical protein
MTARQEDIFLGVKFSVWLGSRQGGTALLRRPLERRGGHLPPFELEMKTMTDTLGTEVGLGC